MSFKSKKFEQGDYTAFLSMKGEAKMKKGEQVFEKVSIGKDEVTGEEVFREVPATHKYTMMNIVKNYPEGQEPEDSKDKESYLFFQSSKVGEADWVCKDKETKEVLGEFDYDEDRKEFVGKIKGKSVRIPVSDVKDRIFQVYEINGSLENAEIDTDMF